MMAKTACGRRYCGLKLPTVAHSMRYLQAKRHRAGRVGAGLGTVMWLALSVLMLAPAVRPTWVSAGNAPPERAVLILGDSLSAAYAMLPEQGWVALLEKRLVEGGFAYHVVNASISGETTGGAAARLPALLDEHRPAIVVVELGGNDGLRGFALEGVRDNLAHIVRSSRQSGARVVLLGMRMPPNYGPKYADAFDAMYAELAGDADVVLVPFFLDGVAVEQELMQQDGIHPTAQAQPALLENVWPYIEPLL